MRQISWQLKVKQAASRSRGFGFVTFKDSSSVEAHRPTRKDVFFWLILYVSTLHHKPHQTTSNHSGVHAKLRFQRDWREVDWGGIGNVDWTKSSCWECRVIRTVACPTPDSIRFNPIQSDSAANEWCECSNMLKHAQTLRLASKCNRLHNCTICTTHEEVRQVCTAAIDVSGKQNTHTRTLYKVSLHAAVFLRWQSLENQVWFYSWKICWWKTHLVFFTRIHKTRQDNIPY